MPFCNQTKKYAVSVSYIAIRKQIIFSTIIPPHNNCTRRFAIDAYTCAHDVYIIRYISPRFSNKCGRDLLTPDKDKRALGLRSASSMTVFRISLVPTRLDITWFLNSSVHRFIGFRTFSPAVLTTNSILLGSPFFRRSSYSSYAVINESVA